MILRYFYNMRSLSNNYNVMHTFISYLVYHVVTIIRIHVEKNTHTHATGRFDLIKFYKRRILYPGLDYKDSRLEGKPHSEFIRLSN